MTNQQVSKQSISGALVERLTIKPLNTEDETRAMIRSEVKDMIRSGELDRDLRRLGWRRQST